MAQVTAAQVTPAQVTAAQVPVEAVLEQLQPRVLPVPIPRASALAGSGAGAAPPAQPHLPGALGPGWISADILQSCPAEPGLPHSSPLVFADRVWDGAAST